MNDQAKLLAALAIGGLVMLAMVIAAFLRFVRRHSCAGCRRLIRKVEQPAWAPRGIVMMRTSSMFTDQEGAGRECDACGRLYCWRCESVEMRCDCGQNRLKMVHLAALNEPR